MEQCKETNRKTNNVMILAGFIYTILHWTVQRKIQVTEITLQHWSWSSCSSSPLAQMAMHKCGDHFLAMIQSTLQYYHHAPLAIFSSDLHLHQNHLQWIGVSAKSLLNLIDLQVILLVVDPKTHWKCYTFNVAFLCFPFVENQGPALLN